MHIETVISRAAGDTGAVLRAVRSAQLAGPTPCAGWDVRTLVNHVLQVGAALALAGRGGPVPSELWTRELIGDDFAERFATDAAAAGEWPATPILLGAYQMPAASVAAMLVCDLAIHGWDLARATGQDYTPDPAAVELAESCMAETADQGRAMGIFAPALPIPPDAAAFDAVLAASGRDRGWRAG